MDKSKKLPGKMHGKHSQKNPNFMSPTWLVKAAREVLGEIDLDPASDEEANKIIKAERIYTAADDGLRKSWRVGESNTTIFLNPPGGLIRTAAARAALPEELRASRSSAAIWWHKLCVEHARGGLEAIFVGFSIELLQSCQAFAERRFHRHPLEFACCFPRERISFVELDEGGERRVAGMPGHGNVIVHLPLRSAAARKAQQANRFEDAFSEYGYVHLP